MPSIKLKGMTCSFNSKIQIFVIFFCYTFSLNFNKLMKGSLIGLVWFILCNQISESNLLYIFYFIRLVKACGDETFAICSNADELTFIYKWGMDGASGQSEYKQTFHDCKEKASDASIFMISLVPLTILSSNSVLWQNNQASSTKYCRPIKFLFEKESTEIVKREHKMVQSEIDALTLSTIKVNGRELRAKHELKMTMVDGKLINEITDTSSSNCNICGAKPSQMNDFDLIEKLICNEKNFSFGVSSLHCWIRCMECLLKIAFRLPIKKWKVMDENDKAEVKKNKQRIQDIFRKETGMCKFRNFWLCNFFLHPPYIYFER